MQEINLSEIKPDLKKILLIGHEGTGKTHFIGTMPKPIYLFSFDKGYLTLAGEPGITACLCMDEDRLRPHAWSDFKLEFDKFKKGSKEYTWPDGRKEKYKTVAFDSFTALSKFIFDHEQRMNNTIDKPAGYTPYTNVKSKLQDVTTQAVLLADYTVFTALIEPDKDEVTGEIFMIPSTEGKFRNEMGQWMDAVFFMTVDKSPSTGEKNYKMLTVGDRRQKAKIRIPSSLAGMINAIEEPDFMKLLAKIDNHNKQEESNVSVPNKSAG